MISKRSILAAAGTPEPAIMPPMLDSIRQRKTLVIIDRDRNMLTVLSHGLSKITDMPEGLKPVSSLAAAMRLVETHRPDVLVCDDGFDHRNKAAPGRLLERAKAVNPDVKFILYGSGFTEEGNNGYAAVIDRIYPEKVLSFVEKLAGSQADEVR